MVRRTYGILNSTKNMKTTDYRFEYNYSPEIFIEFYKRLEYLRLIVNDRFRQYHGHNANIRFINYNCERDENNQPYFNITVNSDYIKVFEIKISVIRFSLDDVDYINQITNEIINQISKSL